MQIDFLKRLQGAGFLSMTRKPYFCKDFWQRKEWKMPAPCGILTETEPEEGVYGKFISNHRGSNVEAGNALPGVPG